MNISGSCVSSLTRVAVVLMADISRPAERFSRSAEAFERTDIWWLSLSLSLCSGLELVARLTDRSDPDSHPSVIWRSRFTMMRRRWRTLHQNNTRRTTSTAPTMAPTTAPPILALIKALAKCAEREGEAHTHAGKGPALELGLEFLLPPPLVGSGNPVAVDVIPPCLVVITIVVSNVLPSTVMGMARVSVVGVAP